MLITQFSCLTHILGFKMLIFGLSFVLYFLKLLAGIGILYQGLNHVTLLDLLFSLCYSGFLFSLAVYSIVDLNLLVFNALL